MYTQKISTTLQELEGFTYATALDLNIGYYTIRLDLGCALLRNYSVITESNDFSGQKYMLLFFYSAVAGAPEFTIIKMY